MGPAIDLRTSGVTALLAALVVAFAGLALGGGCGRTDLDLGFDPVNGSPGTGGGALGGLGGAGVGGTPGGLGGGPAPIICGSSLCKPGEEICCAQPPGAGGPTCVSAQSSNPCAIKLSCLNGTDCQSGESCCFSLGDMSTTCQTSCSFADLELCALQAGCSDSTASCCPISTLMGTGVCLPAGIDCSALHF